MAGTYSFYEKRTKSLVSFPVKGPHECMQGAKHCPACMEEHEILRKHNEAMEANERAKRKGKK